MLHYIHPAYNFCLITGSERKSPSCPALHTDQRQKWVSLLQTLMSLEKNPIIIRHNDYDKFSN